MRASTLVLAPWCLFLLLACGTAHVAMDSGQPDAAMNADGGSPSDGGDGGSSDGGPADAGAPDSGYQDAGLIDSGVPDAGDGGAPDGGPNPIAVENALAGDPSWLIAASQISNQTFAYASPQAVGAGDSLAIRVSSAGGPVSVGLQVFRIGWYGGTGARKVAELSGGDAGVQTCATDLQTGEVECDWPDTFSLTVGSDWTTGFYLAKVTDSAGGSTYAPFVVHETTREAPILVKIPLATYQAYNQFGGASLYDAYTPWFGGTFAYDRAVKVSFDRPYDRGAGAGDFFIWDGAAIRFLERQGYDVGYASSLDLEAQPVVLGGRRLLVSIGHDEYWSKAERDAVQTAVQGAGLNYAIFAGNVGYWHVRYEPSSLGEANRTLVCYRYVQQTDTKFLPNDPTFDPDGGDNSDVTVRWRDYPLLRPENQISGEMYVSVQPVLSRQFVTDPTSWVLAGTGVALGDPLPHSLGWETDVVTPTVDPFCSTCAAPPPGAVAMAQGAFLADAYYDVVPSQMQLLQISADAGTVFEAESYAWVWGLGDTPLTSALQQRITSNVLDRLGAPASTPTPPIGPPPSVDAGWGACDAGSWASLVVLQLDGGYAPVALDFDDGGLIAGDPDNSVVWTSGIGDSSAPVSVDTPFAVLGIAHGGGQFFLLGHKDVAVLTPGPTPTVSVLEYIDSAMSPVQSAAIAYSAFGGHHRLFVLGQAGQLVAIDLDAQAAGDVDVDGIGSGLALVAQGDGTLLVLDGYERPGRIVQVDPTAIVDVTQPPASLPSTVWMDTTQPAGSDVSFGFLETGLLEAMDLAQLPSGTTFAARTGLGDVAQLGFGGQGNPPSICPIAGSGRAGGSWGSVTDLGLPTGLAAGPNGTLLVADPINRRVLQLTPP